MILPQELRALRKRWEHWKTATAEKGAYRFVPIDPCDVVRMLDHIEGLESTVKKAREVKGTIYAVIYTDTWREDYDPVEVWTDRAKAEERAATLSALTPELHWDGKPKYLHVVQAVPFNREAKPEKT